MSVAGPDHDRSRCAIELQCSRVAVTRDALDAGNGPPAQKLQHRRPVVGRLITQQEIDLALRSGRELRPLRAPQCAGRTVEQSLEGLVEPADASEPCSEG